MNEPRTNGHAQHREKCRASSMSNSACRHKHAVGAGRGLHRDYCPRKAIHNTGSMILLSAPDNCAMPFLQLTVSQAGTRISDGKPDTCIFGAEPWRSLPGLRKPVAQAIMRPLEERVG